MNEQEQIPSADSVITLREVTKDNLSDILHLGVRDDQNQFVASNAVSLAQAHFEEKAWFRAIYAGETPVGFVMLYDDPETPEYFLWRFMIDKRYQGYNFGQRAMKLLIEYVRTRPNATELLTSYVPAEGCPEPFYKGLGFIETGDIHDGENVMRLTL
jgi:diamine N-acetyltransferase